MKKQTIILLSAAMLAMLLVLASCAKRASQDTATAASSTATTTAKVTQTSAATAATTKAVTTAPKQKTKVTAVTTVTAAEAAKKTGYTKKESDENGDYTIHYYNSQDRLVKDRLYEDGKLRSETTYTYDKKGFVIREDTKYFGSSKDDYSTAYMLRKNDKKGNPIRCDYYDADGTLFNSVVMEYVKGSDKLSRVMCYDDNGIWYMESVYEYRTDGRTVTEYTITDDMRAQGPYYISEYDAHDKLTKLTYYDYEGRLEYIDEYLSDGSERTISYDWWSGDEKPEYWVTVHNAAKTERISSYYDGDGNLLEKYVYTLDGKGNVLTRSDYDGSETLKYLTTYTYRSEDDETPDVKTVCADGRIKEEIIHLEDGTEQTTQCFYDDETGECYFKAVTITNSDGYELSEKQYDGEGNLTSHTVCTRDEDNTLLSSVTTDGNGLVIEQTVLLENGHRQTTGYEYDTKTGELTSYTVSERNENHREISRSVYEADGTLSLRSECTYDEDGNLLCDATYDGKGNLRHATTYSYDEYGSTLSWQTVDGSDRVLETTVRLENGNYQRTSYEYDEKTGSLLGYTVLVWNEYGCDLSEEKYDAADQLLSKRVCTYNDNGSLLTERSYGEDDNLVSGTDYGYDEDGNSTGYTTFDGQDHTLEVSVNTDDGVIINRNMYSDEGIYEGRSVVVYSENYLVLEVSKYNAADSLTETYFERTAEDYSASYTKNVLYGGTETTVTVANFDGDYSVLDKTVTVTMNDGTGETVSSYGAEEVYLGKTEYVCVAGKRQTGTVYDAEDIITEKLVYVYEADVLTKITHNDPGDNFIRDEEVWSSRK